MRHSGGTRFHDQLEASGEIRSSRNDDFIIDPASIACDAVEAPPCIGYPPGILIQYQIGNVRREIRILDAYCALLATADAGPGTVNLE